MQTPKLGRSSLPRFILEAMGRNEALVDLLRSLAANGAQLGPTDIAEAKTLPLRSSLGQRYPAHFSSWTGL